MCDVIGLSYEEISQAVAIPVGTVRSRIHRGRRSAEGEPDVSSERPLALHLGEVVSAYLDGELPAVGAAPGRVSPRRM